MSPIDYWIRSGSDLLIGGEKPDLTYWLLRWLPRLTQVDSTTICWHQNESFLQRLAVWVTVRQLIGTRPENPRLSGALLTMSMRTASCTATRYHKTRISKMRRQQRVSVVRAQQRYTKFDKPAVSPAADVLVRIVYASPVIPARTGVWTQL